jgi:hypothetical protein
LKADYVNGDLGFDPLNLMPLTQAEFDAKRTKELQNGRLAMISVAGVCCIFRNNLTKKSISPLTNLQLQ